MNKNAGKSVVAFMALSYPHQARLRQFLATLSLSPLLITSPAFGAPQDGTVTSGIATITTTDNNTFIHQTTDKAIINWRQFNIGADEHTQFVQPGKNSVTLNRVTGPDASQILGRLTANGNILLINQNGIIIGNDARIDVGGLIASTADITDDDFNKGNYRFTRPGKADASIENHGTIITRTQGAISLVAPFVSNRGTITAHLGRVQLASGNTWALDMGGLVRLAVDDKVAGSLVQAGLIQADGGQITLTANVVEGMLGQAIQVSGTTRARTVGRNQKGNIIIGGPGSGNITISGNLDADAPDKGDGGKIILKAERDMTFTGKASARGKNGGFVEVSGFNDLDFQGEVSTSAFDGKNGTLLLDPTNLTISNGSGAGIINIANLQNSLASNNVTIQTASTGTQDGDITVTAPLSWTGNNSLTLQAHRNINIMPQGSIINGLGVGSLTLITGALGNLNINAGITVGGNLSITANTLTINQNISGGGILNLLPTLTSSVIGLGEAAAGVFNLTLNEIQNIASGWSAINIGNGNNINLRNSNWVAPVTFNGNITLSQLSTTLDISNHQATFNGTIDGTASGIPENFAVVGTAGSSAIFNQAIGNNVALGNFSITVDQLHFADIIKGTGTMTLQPAADNTSLGISDSAAGIFHLSDSELGFIADGFSSIILGRNTSTASLNLNNATWNDPVTFRSSSAGNIIINGDQRGQGNASITFGGPATFNGGSIFTQGSAINLNGPSIIAEGQALTLTSSGGNITVNGTLNATAGGFDEILTIGAGGGSFTNTAAIGDSAALGDTHITADSINLAASLLGRGLLTLNPFTTNRSIGLGDNSSDSFQLTNQEISRLGNTWQNITIGQQQGTGSIDLRALTWQSPLTIIGSLAHLTINGAQNMSGHNLTISTDSISLLADLIGTGTLTLQPGQIHTDIGLGDGSSGTFNLSNNELSRIHNGWQNIVIGRSDGTGNMELQTSDWYDPIAFRSLTGQMTTRGTINAFGDASLTFDAPTLASGNITTQGRNLAFNHQTTLNDHLVFNTDGGDITFNSALSGNNHNLTLSAGNGNITFNGPITDLGSGVGAALTVSNANLTRANGTIHANSGLNVVSPSTWSDHIFLNNGDTGSHFAQDATFAGLTFDSHGGVTFSGNVNLADNDFLFLTNGGDALFSGTLNGGQSFNASLGGGTLTFAQAVGNTTPLRNIYIDGASAVNATDITAQQFRTTNSGQVNITGILSLSATDTPVITPKVDVTNIARWQQNLMPTTLLANLNLVDLNLIEPAAGPDESDDDEEPHD